ncbi:hypothetical protein BUALT_Bualt02G0035000 [Buddleja alternifolia]|uniref:Mitochondrial ATPase complex subunit ATP10 n=1 Tax=Buddleja alternifolia TaxID=168488 RepID=A0AAV6XXQ2_9LAMI|nr:hypothetical protein BUALT_Bualt02G0035000 [Buddleja alternifolia]
MMRFKKLLQSTPRNVNAINMFKGEANLLPIIPLHNPSQWTSNRFLDIYQDSKDEMNRGYFADMSEMKQHNGKITAANKIIIPAMAAVKFPTFEVNYSNGRTLKLPVTSSGNDTSASNSDIPKASLLCLSFRASSQPMVDSWSLPFLNTFGHSSDVQLYEVSFIDSWLLNRFLIKKLLLKIMRKAKPAETKDILQKQIVYSFGDHYYFRKELKILNLLTGYIFLVDKLGRIRWQGTGLATQDELLSLLSCTSLLLEES